MVSVGLFDIVYKHLGIYTTISIGGVGGENQYVAKFHTPDLRIDRSDDRNTYREAPDDRNIYEAQDSLSYPLHTSSCCRNTSSEWGWLFLYGGWVYLY